MTWIACCSSLRGRPPHKAHLGASAAQRLEMTKLATQGLPWAEASDIEVFREGTIYTVDTLTDPDVHSIRKRISIISSGRIRCSTFPTGAIRKRCARCAALFAFAVQGIDFRRMEETLERLHAECDANVEIVNAFGPDISSTEIRNRIRSGEPTDGLLPEAVRVYIDREKLYRLWSV